MSAMPQRAPEHHIEDDDEEQRFELWHSFVPREPAPASPGRGILPFLLFLGAIVYLLYVWNF